MNHLPQLKTLYETTHGVIRVNTEGVTHAESLVQPPPGGNCMNWVVGHVMSSRQGEAGLDRPHERMGSVGAALYILNFHEAYHSGQTGVIRRLIGKPGAIR